MVKGVERDPGEITAVFKPSRASVSTKTEAHNVFVFLKSSIHRGDRGSLNVPDFAQSMDVLTPLGRKQRSGPVGVDGNAGCWLAQPGLTTDTQKLSLSRRSV